MLAQVLRVHREPPTVSVTAIGRYCVMWFSMCTEPIAANGKSKPVTNAMTVGNVSANG